MSDTFVVPESERHTEQITVDAGNPTVRVEVLDHAFRLKARGYGRIKERLPTGLYTIRYEAADASEELDVVLRPGVPVVLDEAPTLKYASVAPISSTYSHTTHEYHEVSAESLSRMAPLRKGKGAEIFVYVRDAAPGGDDHPARGLSIRSADGKLVVDFGHVAKTHVNADDWFSPARMKRRGDTWAKWTGRLISIDPGYYRIRVDHGVTSVETAVMAWPGWQTQVFMLREPTGLTDEENWAINLAGATKLMVRPGEGFDAARVHSWRSGDDIRFVELALHALSSGRGEIRGDDLQELLRSRPDPTLSILGAHLLLMDSAADLSVAATVVDGLRQNLGDFRHPDVDALIIEIARRRGKRIQQTPVAWPPMFRRSWHMLVRATSENPSLIPEKSLAAEIAGRLWGSGPWLVWQISESFEDRAPGRVESHALDANGRGRLRDLIARLAAGGAEPVSEALDPLKVQAILGSRPLSSDTLAELLREVSDVPLVRALDLVSGEIKEVIPGARLSHGDIALDDGSDAVDTAILYQIDSRARVSVAQLVTNLDLPAVVVKSALARLLSKLLLYRAIAKPDITYAPPASSNSTHGLSEPQAQFVHSGAEKTAHAVGKATPRQAADRLGEPKVASVRDGKAKVGLLLNATSSNPALIAGGLAALQGKGVQFDLISTVGSGTPIGLLYVAAKGSSPREALERIKEIGVHDAIYNHFPVNFKLFQKPGVLADAYRRYLQSLPRLIPGRNDASRLLVDWMMFWFGTWCPSDLSLNSLGLCAHAPWVEEVVDFEKLRRFSGEFYINAYCLEDRVLEIFNKDEITADHVRAALAFPYVYPPFELNGKTYIDGSMVDTLGLRGVLDYYDRRMKRTQHVGALDHLVAFDVPSPPSLLREPRDLYDAWVQSIMVPLATLAKNDIDLFQIKYKNEWADRWNKNAEEFFLKIELDIPRENSHYVLDWSYSNLSMLYDIGHKAGLNFFERHHAKLTSASGPIVEAESKAVA